MGCTLPKSTVPIYSKSTRRVTCSGLFGGHVWFMKWVWCPMHSSLRFMKLPEEGGFYSTMKSCGSVRWNGGKEGTCIRISKGSKQTICENITFTCDCFFFKANTISSLVECTWTLKNVIIDQNLCSWQKLHPKTNLSQPSLRSIKWHIWHFYVPRDVFTNTMFQAWLQEMPSKSPWTWMWMRAKCIACPGCPCQEQCY